MRAKASKFQEAAEFFKQAFAWKPDLPGLDRNWGLASFRAELYAEAVPPLERQLKAQPHETNDPNAAFTRQILGLSYYVLENYPKVVDVLRPLLEHPPDDPGLLLAWGTALVRTHQSVARHQCPQGNGLGRHEETGHGAGKQEDRVDLPQRMRKHQQKK